MALFWVPQLALITAAIGAVLATAFGLACLAIIIPIPITGVPSPFIVVLGGPAPAPTGPVISCWLPAC